MPHHEESLEKPQYNMILPPISRQPPVAGGEEIVPYKTSSVLSSNKIKVTILFILN